MILDNEVLLSDGQAITASAASEDVMDLGHNFDAALGGLLPFALRVTEAFNNLTSLTVAWQTDDNVGFSSAKTLESRTFPLAELTAGAILDLAPPRHGVERYLRLYFTVTGSAPTTGKVTAGFTPVTPSDPNKNKVGSY